MKYVIAKNGLFKEVKNALFEGCFKVDGNPSAPELKEIVRCVMRKIPVALLKQAIAFAKWGKDEKKSEISLVLVDDKGTWKWACPHQWNSAGHVCGHPELTAEEFYGWMGDYHSHPDGFSQHSSTDEKDERKRRNGVFIVTSGYTLLSARPTIIGMFEGRRFELDLGDVFDVHDDTGVYSFPEEWKSRVHGSPCEECKRNPPPSSSTSWVGTSSGPHAVRLSPNDLGRDKKRIVIELEEGESFGDWLMRMHENLKENDPSFGLNATFMCRGAKCNEDVDLGECPGCKEPITDEDMLQNAAEIFEAAVELMEEREAIQEEGGR